MTKNALTLDEACEYLGIARPTLYKHACSGTIPATKVGRLWRFHSDTLDQWLRDRVQVDTAARAEASVTKVAK